MLHVACVAHVGAQMHSVQASCTPLALLRVVSVAQSVLHVRHPLALKCRLKTVSLALTCEAKLVYMCLRNRQINRQNCHNSLAAATVHLARGAISCSPPTKFIGTEALLPDPEATAATLWSQPATS